MAGESAKFGISEAKWSLYPMGGSAVRLVRQIPYTVACDLLLTGRHITAAEAKDMGLIGHVVPDGQALTKALEIAEVIENNGPLAVQAILKTIRETEGMHEEEAFKPDTANGIPVFLSEDSKEGPGRSPRSASPTSKTARHFRRAPHLAERPDLAERKRTAKLRLFFRSALTLARVEGASSPSQPSSGALGVNTTGMASRPLTKFAGRSGRVESSSASLRSGSRLSTRSVIIDSSSRAS